MSGISKMPGGHFGAAEIGRYLARGLTAEEVLALHSHARECAECRHKLEEAAGERYSAMAEHLNEDELAEYLAGHAGVTLRERAARHLRECGECAEGAREMQGTGSPARRAWPAWTAAAAAVLLAAGGAAWLGMRGRPAERAALRDGGSPVRLASDGSLEGLAGAAGEERAWVAAALRSGRVELAPPLRAAAPSELRDAGAGGGEAWRVVAPLNQRVLTDRPAFSWKPLAGADGYEVIVTDESLAPVARSGRIGEVHWTPGDPLPRGRRLLWQVRAQRSGGETSAPAPPEPPAVFEVVPAADAERIARAEAAPQRSHLLLAVLYGRVGLAEKAAAEIDALAAENGNVVTVPGLMKR
jgi:hypothetical protein